MNMSDEMERLSRLHQEGHLSDTEFAEAKRKLLRESEQSAATPMATPPTRAAEGEVTFWSIMGAIGIGILLFIFLAVCFPHLRHFHHFH